MTPTIKDISNIRFGRLIALRVSHKQCGRYKWVCVCDCGNERTFFSGNLISGSSKSCGCAQPSKHNVSTHGDCRTREYRIYHKMMTRCYNEAQEEYKNYGGRGIAVCDRWLESYENFLTDMGRSPSKTHSIDRKDNDGNYEPNNCRWATRKEQNNNRRSNIKISFNGETKTLTQWCDVYNVNYASARYRLNKGKSIASVFNQQ